MRFSGSLSRCSAIILLTGLTAMGCGSKPQRRQAVAVAPMVNVSKLASKAFEQVKAKTMLDEDRRANAYIVCVAEAVVHDIGGDWEIAIFRRDAPNAFVLPGGKIGVYTGILRVARNQHQLAAVLAHGLAHVRARHPEKRVSRQLHQHPGTDFMKSLDYPGNAESQLAMSLLGIGTPGSSEIPFDHGEESEANVLGLDLMARAGFNPEESLSVWQALERTASARSDSFAAMHPSYGSRKPELERRMGAARGLRDQSWAGRKKPDCDRLR